ncbi:hypothetical protein PC116_g9314 [Phytophthora cactorum]|uniref:Uncharacterized protein n=1 Tax=Phytophthora cactorum TaxID=29920 RepID=A0A8T0Z6E1_9STRA|nr:hypothetical protein PC113_g10376 [Phytophthora cactorum]KAG3166360.1 hypothetical protein C6341_g12097 [Phytophthora cactorum]KAG4242810.1 hypothetical protein PC116_g9314 [Phytophthora cactorum]
MYRDTSRSNTGFVLQLQGLTWMWRSKQQGRVTKNTCASELVAASACVDDLVWARQLLSELVREQGVSTVYCDNQSTIQVIANRGNSKRVQRYAKEARMIAEFVDDGVVDVKYVSTTENVADILAKAFRPSAFRVSPPKAQHGERAECTGEHAGGAGEGRLGVKLARSHASGGGGGGERRVCRGAEDLCFGTRMAS